MTRAATNRNKAILAPSGAFTTSRSQSGFAESSGASIELRLPIRTVNALNRREHWAKRAKRSKDERFVACSSVAYAQIERYGATGIPSGCGCAVTLTREAPRSMDAGCGLNASLKAIRDGVADALGVNDNDPRVTWTYRQRKAKEYGVVIEIRPA